MNIAATLETFGHFGVKLGLESIRRLLAQLGNPHERVPVIHVAGSNGKGSVCAYLSAILTTAGYKVGRYTSPHLVDWNERIYLNEQPITNEALEQVLQEVIAAIQPDGPSPTQFEVITAAAWLYFAQQQVDVAVMEVGLGGRLDATNVCDRPLVSIIVSISREHWQRLGPTLADIAGEKAGILKPACPAVIGQLPPEAMTVVNQRLAELSCPAVYPSPAVFGESHQWAEFQTIRYPLPLQGEVQLHNSALAIAALQILRQQGWQISDAAIAQGMAKTRWPGRLQWYQWRDRTILVDGAHNPASAEVLRHFVDVIHPHAPTFWVMGMLSTKDHADVFHALLRPGDRLYLAPVPDHLTAEPTELAELALTICPTLAGYQTFADVFAALDAAIAMGDRRDDTTPPLIVLCGSLYLLGYFFKVARTL